MKVSKQTLLLIAGLVWGAAGFNILRIGLLAYAGHPGVLQFLLSAVVFAVFGLFVFLKMVRKHTARILNYERAQFFLKFFDGKSFAMMAFMMTFGIWLRISGICPEVFIAVFYTGLGGALFMAGILFLARYAGALKKKAEAVSETENPQ